MRTTARTSAAFLLLGCLWAADAAANTLSGTVRYRDKVISTTDGTVTSTPMAAARYVALDFVRASDLTTVLGSTTTDGSGHFTSPDIGAHSDIVVLVKATGTYENQTVVVRDQSTGGGAIQTFQSAQFDLSGGNLAGQTIDITTDDIAGAFNIYDCMIRAHTYVREQLFATPPTVTAFTLTVRWEDGKDSEDGSPSTTYVYVVGGSPYMNVLGDTSVDSDAFDDAVLLHEYGHVAAFLYSKDDSPGGSHLLGDALDLRLAFSEGWADFFSCAARGTRWYVDTTAGLPLLFEIATPAVNGAPGTSVTGPENELAVAAVLWDLVNSLVPVNHGAIDTMREALWDVFDNYLPSAGVTDVCLEDLWDGFFESTVTPAYGAANRTAMNNIINAHDVRYFVDSFEANGSAAAATAVLTDGTAVDCTFYHDPDGNGIGDGDEDWFSFNAEAGKNYTLETLHLGNSADTVLRLYDTDGTTILANSDNISTTNLASQIVYTFTTAGKYYVRCTRSTDPLPIVDPPPDDPDPAQGARANYGYYQFRITEGGTGTGPTVVAVSPFDGATDVAITTTVVATFSQPVKAATVTTTSFTVHNGTTAVAGTVALDASRTIATFTPNTGLLNNTTYTVRLTADIQDDAGRPLTAFTSSFTTVAGGTPPPGGVPRVPRAQIASGDGYVDIEWVYPTATHDGVIVAYARDRFPTLGTVEQDGVTNLAVTHGTELYRGNTDTQKRVTTTNGQRVFAVIWAFIGSTAGEPYYLASRASRGGRGIIDPLNATTSDPEPGPPTLTKPARFQAVSGDGFVDVEWVPATGTFDGVIVAVGSRTLPKIEQVVTNGTLALRVTRGTELYRGDDQVRFRLTTTNGTKRLFAIWTYKGTDYSRALYASTRAASGAKGLTESKSFYGAAFEEPEVLN